MVEHVSLSVVAMKLLYACLALLLSTLVTSDQLVSEDRLVAYLGESGPIQQGKAELVFLLDRSGSVGAADFEAQKGFVESFLTHVVVDVNATRVAVLSYSDTAEVHLDYLRAPRSKCHLSVDLRNVVFRDSGATNTAAALATAKEIFRNARPGVHKVMVLISDGVHTRGDDPALLADDLKESGVEVFCFGVGRFVRDELLRLASSDQHVFACPEFRDFTRLARKIRGDPHGSVWSGAAAVPNCDHLCQSPYRGDPSDPGCCDHHAACSCALLAGQHTCVCGPGYFGLSGLPGRCTACPQGWYKHTLEPLAECFACPDDSSTAREGSTSLEDCRCREGFKGNPQQGEPCIKIECPPLQAPTNGHLLGECERSFGSECHFDCAEGYELVDDFSAIRKCKAGGQWSESTPICRRIKCPPLGSPVYGWIHCDLQDRAVGTKCQLGCLRGYVQRGPMVRECLDTKRWSEDAVTCEPVECDVPPVPRYGRVYGCTAGKRPLYGEACIFSCNAGFKLIGPHYLYCMENGKLMHGPTVGGGKPLCRDETPPEVWCPHPVFVSPDRGRASARAAWKPPRATDNSGLTPKMWSNLTRQPGAEFPIGVTVIRYEAADLSGLRSHCDLKIVVVDREPPTVVRCPSKVFGNLTGDREPVYWDEPIFEDNSKKELVVKKSSEPGEPFGVGRHTVKYTAIDPSGNEADCIFHVIMTQTKCPFHPPPMNGALTCNDWTYGQFCQVFCNDRFDFVEKPAYWYICDSASKWSTLPPELPVPWPNCAKPVLPHKIRLMASGFYYSGNCNDPMVQQRLKKQLLIHLQSQWAEARACLVGGACSMETVRVICGDQLQHTGRRKRRSVHQEGEELEVEFEIRLVYGKKLTEEETGAILKDFLDTVDNIGWDESDDDVDWDGELQLVLTDGRKEIVCEPGSVPSDYICVLCTPGSHFDNSSSECSDCPRGFFQDSEGQLQCQPCPEGTSTEYAGASNETDCITLCPTGSFSESGLATCMACPRGTFQDQRGSRDCVPCPDSQQTTGLGSSSQTDCRDPCVPGFISDSGIQPCEACPLGHYQPLSGQKHCTLCPNNTTTLLVGATALENCTAITVEPCAGKCLNGASCETDGSCACAVGFTGSLCEEDFDECSEDVCQNGGQCINTDGSYHCNCAEGFQGVHCELEIDECRSGPCLNNATCLDKINGYECVCEFGFEGSNCERGQDICEHGVACKNGGRCVVSDDPSTDTPLCQCQTGYSGVDCSIDVDKCLDVDCSIGDVNMCLDGACLNDGRLPIITQDARDFPTVTTITENNSENDIKR